MNRADVAKRLSNLAGPEVAKPSDETVAHVVALIGSLNTQSPLYQPNVETLLSLEATIWARECGAKLQN
ncbi:hypothetical protein [Variovorax boronicumulans]|uniref:hypothetical protein n=1 Tax=Variovorax boronicumulans TaxID=436515 RepID=UPI00339A7C2C